MKISAINNIYSKPIAFKQNQIQKDTSDLSKYYVTKSSINLRELSDERLEEMLLEKVNKAAFFNMRYAYPYRETNPIKLLSEILSDADVYECGLSNERLTELYNVARRLNDKIMLAGSKELIKR